MGCTIGATTLEPGAEYVLFKNKDLRKESFDDQLCVTDDCFGVRGLHLPPKGREHEEELSGFSIGLNRHGVSACNSHVRSIEDGLNYDLLTEAAVTGVTSVGDALENVRRLAAEKAYNRANIIVADPHEIGVIEIADDCAQATELRCIARANKHLLPHADRAPSDPCPRASRAIAAVGSAVGVDDFFTLLRSHEGETDRTNICRHGEPLTVYSYILHWRRGRFDLHVCQGPPCRSQYVSIPLDFPIDPHALAALYPMAHHR